MCRFCFLGGRSGGLVTVWGVELRWFYRGGYTFFFFEGVWGWVMIL